MNGLSVAELIPILQTAIGPVILISGVGLLLLTMTNRLGRIIDRTRSLAQRITDSPAERHQRERAQLEVLWQRARHIRLAIALASASALCAALLIVVVFLTALLRLEVAWLIGTLFTAAMASLVASLLLFLRDVEVSLAAVKLELDALPPPPESHAG